jgi:hypothetical protein
LWIDRRVDRSLRLSYNARQTTVAALVDGAASQLGVVATPFDTLVYVGPARSAAALPRLSTAWRREASAALRRREPLVWPRLAEPRELLAEVAARAGLEVENPRSIPHDLWPSGRTPSLARGDQITLIALGFDLGWELTPTEKIRLIPLRLNEDDVAPRLAAAVGPPRPIAADERYSLRVADASLMSVASQVALQLGLELRVDPALVTRDPRVSFSVRDATRDELIAALAEAADCDLQESGGELVVSPRRTAAEE